MEGGFYPRTVEDLFKNFEGRRVGVIKALTTDVQKFLEQCDPEKENLCLYGFPDETWEVSLPEEEVPPELPEPALGINFARGGMQEKDWLSFVAVHSDAWLLAVAFYFGAHFGFDKNDRKDLFQMINDLPTIFEVVTGAVKKQPKDKSPATPNSSNENESSGEMQPKSEMESLKMATPKEEEDEEQGMTLCGVCDICEKWFHRRCVKVTPARG